MNQTSEMALFVGRMHPLVVHLPIGMLLLLAILECLALVPRFKSANLNAGYIIALTIPAAVVSVFCGWLLANAGGYDSSLLFWHRWMGICTMVGVVAAGGLYWFEKVIFYRIILFVSVATLMVTGHLGGSLTHGEDYLERYAPEPIKQILGLLHGKSHERSVAGGEHFPQSVYSKLIVPIFEAKCVGCHGVEKNKGGLRLDSFAALQKGGDNGPVLKPGDAEQSMLIQRLLLPVDHDDHMPPAGKVQLTSGEVTVLKWWINAGASEKSTLGELPISSSVQEAMVGISPAVR